MSHRVKMSGLFDWWKKKPGVPREPVPVHVDLYGILGVNPRASDAEIKKAFRELSLKFHPDRNPDDPIAERKYTEITNAYAILSDVVKRSAYDQAVGTRLPPEKRTLIPAEPMRPGELPPVKPKAKPRPFWEVIARGEKPKPKEEVFEVFSPTPRAPTIPSARDPHAWATERARRVPLTPGIDTPTVEELYQVIQLWPLDAVWDLVRGERQKYAFQQARAMAVDVVAGAGETPPEWEIADMFDIPLRQAEEFIRHRGREAFYAEILYPLFDEITKLFRQIKPADIPGEFFLDWDPNGKRIELIYAELPGRRP